MPYTIQQIGAILDVPVVKQRTDKITILLTDSRKLSLPAETLFFALETKNNDAHIFIHELYEKGVRNFVVSKVLQEWEAFSDANFLKVKSSLAALQKIAAYHRKQFSIDRKSVV